MKKFITWISLALILSGVLGFILNLLISFANIGIDIEMPLFNIQGAVEKNSKLYLGLGFYNRIQVYDLSGNYTGFIKTKNYAKDFDFVIDKNGNAETTINYMRKYIDYSIKDDSSISIKQLRYFPKKIVCNTREAGDILLADSFLKSLWSGPVIPWLLAVFGFIVLAITNPYKITGMVNFFK